jgi:MOSC domain-containing protein YiiM
MEALDEVEAVAGRGIKGDRYYLEEGMRHSAVARPRPKRPEEVTIFSLDALEEGCTETCLVITPLEMRRNIAIRGADLEAVVGSTFFVGDVEVEATHVNPPCRHLIEMAGKDFLKPFIKRGGIRGRILTSGTIRVGDPVSDRRAERSSQADTAKTSAHPYST